VTTHRAIVDSLYSSAAGAEPVVLATVVRISGSSYGGVGTRMVAKVDGTTVGIVSGGCLETDLAEHAREVSETGVPRVVTYDTRADDETAWGLGLGCNGLIDVLLEPLTHFEAGVVGRLLEQALSEPVPTVLATVIASSGGDEAPAIGAHALFANETVETIGNWGDRSALESAKGDLDAALASGRRGLVAAYEGCEVSFEVVAPSIRLAICGGGPDVAPVAELAAQLGWRVAVVDHRAPDATHAGRFPGALIVECQEPGSISECIALTPMTAAVVMSHNFARDTEYVRALLASDVSYIGVLGPRARSERMLAQLGVTEPDGRLFAPVGLDLGGDGPEAIALSIVAEVSAAMARRKGGHLRARSEPLHT
jgi:xanthine/CO dehydrogenase XdhC/CoxF family maturation factor